MIAERDRTPEAILTTFRQIWGYDNFRPPQGEVIQGILNHQDVLVVMPTGGGKSVCFQLPALMQQGVTLVVSPLVALMENQVQELRQHRLPAAMLHSELPRHQRHQTLKALEQQQLRLLYLSPETLLSTPVWERLCQPELQINGLILDEAHCLVQWGDTFRPAYRRLGAVRPALLRQRPVGTRLPIAAFTATADPQARQTIEQVLQLQRPQRVTLSPYRSNLQLQVKTAWSPRHRRQQLIRCIQAHTQSSGLVYVRTRQASETLATELIRQGYATAAYHAGLDPLQRRQIEADWLSDRLQFVICTSAFGMGINKSNVRWIVHFHAPSLLSEYIQEIGRAGRDGQPATALTLVGEPTGWLDSEDKQRQQFFEHQVKTQQQSAQQLVRQIPTEGAVSTISQQFAQGAIALALLHSQGQLEWQDPFHYRLTPTSPKRHPDSFTAGQAMARYLKTRQCRWQYLLNQFGAQTAPTYRCQHCDNCLKK